MGKFKSQSLARIPKDQRCQFLIGPTSSWFMPNTSDLWTRPSPSTNQQATTSDQSMSDEIDSMEAEENSMSYFVYGSNGCFCYGEIFKSTNLTTTSQNQNLASMSAIVSHLVDIKEDNSKVSCIRFLKPALFPIIMALTESGSLIIHDCVKDEILIHLRKSELISKFVDSPISDQDNSVNEHHNKKTKFNVIQQINSCSWPNATNAFLGISLLKEKTNLLIWMKLRDLTAHNDFQITKSDLIEAHYKLDLDLDKYSSPICCMETILLNQKSCLLAVAMDDGLIKIVTVNFVEGQAKRIIDLTRRHNDQICSMSLFLGDRKRFPLGLLASVSRDGLTLLWDIENEFYFADYQAASGGAANPRINWFALSFVSNKETNQTKLAVSNSESGLTLLDIPENTRSKVRLKVPAKEKQLKSTIPDIRHQALIFNVISDPVSEIIMTSSLDGNHILWSCRKLESFIKQSSSKKTIGTPIQVKSQYLIPSLTNNSRVHMMRHSPIQENLLGICLGKAGVRFYRITEDLAQSKFDMSPVASMVARKITREFRLCPTSLSWHPRNEYRLAIGTIEGKVLRVDLTPNRSNQLIKSEYRKPSSRERVESMSVDHDIKNECDLFGVEYKPISHEADGDPVEKNQNKTDGIYSICWGPDPTCSQDENRLKLAIYAVSSITHRLFIYYSNKDEKLIDYLEEFLDASLPEAVGEASEVAWKSTLDLMALGTTHGEVIIVKYLEESHADYSRNNLFKRLAVIKGPMGKTYIQCLAWHPTLVKDDDRYHHIACSANGSALYVFDIRRAKDDNNLASDVRTKLNIENGQVVSSTVDDLIISEFLYKLDDHKKPISDVAWNPHYPDQLATCSFDRTCNVWSLDESSSSSNGVRLHSKFCARDRLFTLEWSIVDKDLLYTSGHDSTVWAWRPSENVNKTNTETQS